MQIMNLARRVGLSATMLLCTFAATAGLVTIDFEGSVAPGTTGQLGTYIEDGYTLVSNTGTNSAVIYAANAFQNAGGSTALAFCSFNGTCIPGTVLSLTGPELFDLVSVEHRPYPQGNTNGLLRVFGYLDGVEVYDTTATTGALATFNLAFTGVDRVEIASYNTFALFIDNIVLRTPDGSNGVPEPGSLPLVAAALVAGGLVARKRKTAATRTV